jgi:anti-sigma factor RsiW
MRCVDVRTKLQAYLDGELSPEESVLVGEHLDGCEPCRAEMARLAAVAEALETWPLVEEPAGLTARVMAQVRRRPALPPFRLHWSDLAIGLAGGGAVFAALILWRYLIPAGQSFLYYPDLYLRLEMLRLELLLLVPRLIRAGVFPWGLLVVGVALALVLIPLVWSPVTWRKRTV